MPLQLLSRRIIQRIRRRQTLLSSAACSPILEITFSRRVIARHHRNRALVSSTCGARYRSARDNQRSLSALIICMLGCVELLTASGGSYRGHGDSAVWHVLSMYSRVYWHVVVCIGMYWHVVVCIGM